MKKLPEWLSMDVSRVVYLILACYFLFLFHSIAGFSPHIELTSTSIAYLVLFIFFLILPSASKLKLGKILEYESKVEAVKKEVKEFKDETRQTLLLQNSLINTVSNSLSQSININIPGLSEIRAAKEELDETIEGTEEPESIEREIDEFLASEGSDLNFALAKLRMEIERELRTILGKRTTTTDPFIMQGKFLSARSLFREFIKKFPKYEGMNKSFDYILKICNAAIHGQNISQDHAHEALYMGLRMLDELKKVGIKEF